MLRTSNPSLTYRMDSTSAGFIQVQPQVQVSDAMVEDEVERLQKRSGHAEDVEEISHKENVLKLQLQSANEAGEAIHQLVIDTTLPEEVEVVFELR